MSSANSSDINLEERGRSFMYNKNRRGPRIDPWGTPSRISKRGLNLFLMLTNCLRFLRYDLNHSSSMPIIPYLLSLLKSISWLQVSNAFLRSQKIAIVCFFLLRASVILFKKWTIGCDVECADLKPNCHLLRILFSSKKDVSLEATIFSIILEKVLRSEIGR